MPRQTAPPLKKSFDMTYLESTIGYSIRRAQMAVFQSIYVAFAGKGITLVQFSVMAVAADNPEITQAELAELLAVERPRIVPILNKLEQQDLAKRIVCESDRRNRRIVLTSKGQTLLSDLKLRFAKHEREVEKKLGEEKLELLRMLNSLSGLGQGIRRSVVLSPERQTQTGRKGR